MLKSDHGRRPSVECCSRVVAYCYCDSMVAVILLLRLVGRVIPLKMYTYCVISLSRFTSCYSAIEASGFSSFEIMVHSFCSSGIINNYNSSFPT